MVCDVRFKSDAARTSAFSWTRQIYANRGGVEKLLSNFFEISHVIALPSRIGLSQNSPAGG